MNCPLPAPLVMDPDLDSLPTGRLAVGLIDTPFMPVPDLCGGVGAVPNAPGAVKGIAGPKPGILMPALTRELPEFVCWCCREGKVAGPSDQGIRVAGGEEKEGPVAWIGVVVAELRVVTAAKSGCIGVVERSSGEKLKECWGCCCKTKPC